MIAGLDLRTNNVFCKINFTEIFGFMAHSATIKCFIHKLSLLLHDLPPICMRIQYLNKILFKIKIFVISIFSYFQRIKLVADRRRISSNKSETTILICPIQLED